MPNQNCHSKLAGLIPTMINKAAFDTPSLTPLWMYY